MAEALAKGAGTILQDESDEIIAKLKNGKVSIGRSVVTGAGKLSAQYVIHTVGPRQKQHMTDKKLIVKAFRGALVAAERFSVRTLAMPQISAGIFGVPLQDVIRAMHEALMGHNSVYIEIIDIYVTNKSIRNQVKHLLIKNS